MCEAPERIWIEPDTWYASLNTENVEYVRADRIEELEAKLAKAVRFIEHAVELGRWDLNPSFCDEMIGFTTKLKGQDDEHLL